MKTLRVLFFLAAIISISVAFNACKGPDDPIVPAALTPSITATTPTTTTMDVDRYQDIPFNLTFKYNLTSKKMLSKVMITAKYSPGLKIDTLVNSTGCAGKDTWNLQYLYTVPGDVSYTTLITITATVEDADGKIGTKNFNFTVKDLSDIREIFVNNTMGAQGNTTYGSFFRSDSCTIVKSIWAKANQSLVDFVYFNDLADGNGDCIGAPNDALLAKQTVNLCGTWTTKNATKFIQIPAMSDSAYNKIRSKKAISDLYNGVNILTVIKTLTDGGGGTDPTYIVFKTAATTPRYGIIRIITLTKASDEAKNSVLLNVKVGK